MKNSYGCGFFGYIFCRVCFSLEIISKPSSTNFAPGQKEKGKCVCALSLWIMCVYVIVLFLDCIVQGDLNALELTCVSTV